jgi:hypothetical protein
MLFLEWRRMKFKKHLQLLLFNPVAVVAGDGHVDGVVAITTDGRIMEVATDVDIGKPLKI